MEHYNAVILAGGSGTRLWPLSTPAFPKQFLPLPNGRSLIQESLARLTPLIAPEQCWVVTGRSIAGLAHEHLPSVPESQILGEPVGRNTSAAIAWAAATIAAVDPQAIIAIVTADHVIRKVDVFNQSLRLAARLAGQGFLVTLGIKPTAPETGYGYIRYAELASEGFDHEAFVGERFVEKPDLTTAKKYLQEGRYVWNSGMFIWKAQAILAELRQHLPELMRKIDIMVATMGSPQERATFDEFWPTLQSISIDYGVLEKTKKLVVIPVDIDWNDVGNWEQYASLFDADEQGVRSVGAHKSLGSKNSFVYNNTVRQVFTIGLEDVIIVVLEDKTLICHRDAVQRVKELAESQLKKV